MSFPKHFDFTKITSLPLKLWFLVHKTYTSNLGIFHIIVYLYFITSPCVQVAKFAQEWADHLASTGSFEHRSQSNPYGENIFWSSGTASAHKVVEAWYSEIKDYTNYTVDPFKTGSE